ncbi:hypothetical protein BDR03DRAFT_953100 [Suillus americanus]|nr:hypothetical protein BDR03DRAFT_953100 [Suillus americanus]
MSLLVINLVLHWAVSLSPPCTHFESWPPRDHTMTIHNGGVMKLSHISAVVLRLAADLLSISFLLQIPPVHFCCVHIHDMHCSTSITLAIRCFERLRQNMIRTIDFWDASTEL